MRLGRTSAAAPLAAALLALALAACAPGAPEQTASARAPRATAVSPTHSAAVSSSPAAAATSAPSAADLDGTWCRAADPATCLTIESGSATDGATVRDAGDDEGAPCLTVLIGFDGGFVAYDCPKGVSSSMPITTDAGAEVNLDNTAYDRLFVTQNPPYVDTWYREGDLSAASMR